MGHELPVFAARWISSDSSIATVDSVGQLYAKRSGLVDILLSAGGWRATHRQFVIRRDTPVVVMHEDWRDPFTSRWVPFGVPLPRIVNDSVLGNAFLNNGDGWYFSGAYLARPLDARHGLSIDATIRTPITRPIERYLEIAVFPIRGIAQLRSAWDHRTGYFPYRFTTGGHCDFSYPAGEGPQSERAASGVGPLTRYAHGRVVLASGAPARLRLQIFPDGSCGVALEGERPLIRDKILASLDSIIVLIQGNSVGTRLLVGPLVITQGVPTGIDWLHGTRQAVSVATTPWEP